MLYEPPRNSLPFSGLRHSGSVVDRDWLSLPLMPSWLGNRDNFVAELLIATPRTKSEVERSDSIESEWTDEWKYRGSFCKETGIPMVSGSTLACSVEARGPQAICSKMQYMDQAPTMSRLGRASRWANRNHPFRIPLCFGKKRKALGREWFQEKLAKINAG